MVQNSSYKIYCEFTAVNIERMKQRDMISVILQCACTRWGWRRNIKTNL